MDFLRSIWNGILESFEENNDPRTKDLFLISSPVPLVSIMVSYLIFTLYVGPKFMQHRKPFVLKNTLIVYNAIQVLISLYLCIWGFWPVWATQYSYICQPIDYSDSPSAQHINNLAWWYYFAKITELLDTVFFILRKKNNQVTFLHVYHHTVMPLFSYYGVRYYPNGHGTLFGVLNSMVHVVMYTYYLIAGLGPQYQKYLWWKKHVTTIQLVQFALIFLHNFPPLFTSCNYPKSLNLTLVIESTTFLYLFGKFYVKSYFRTEKKDLNAKANGFENGKAKSLTNGITNGRTKLSTIGEQKRWPRGAERWQSTCSMVRRYRQAYMTSLETGTGP
ncbi:GNS1/SUR4 family domain-containing protein [Phthorimaea operculella]|nr:GNS1/SUR4 family domain-containing protein [Phthorimaea operculella]